MRNLSLTRQYLERDQSKLADVEKHCADLVVDIVGLEKTLLDIKKLALLDTPEAHA